MFMKLLGASVFCQASGCLLEVVGDNPWVEPAGGNQHHELVTFISLGNCTKNSPSGWGQLLLPAGLCRRRRRMLSPLPGCALPPPVLHEVFIHPVQPQLPLAETHSCRE